MPSHSPKDLLANNRAWAAATTKRDPTHFDTLAQQQAPKYMWIGCSDSRVPANELLGLRSGELFVHRNVANVVVHTDLNCLSVVQFAVDVLKVRYIIVCGHFGCSGVGAAALGQPIGLADNWLRHVQDVGERHAALLSSRPNDKARADLLTVLNVIEQSVHLSRTTIVQDAWKRNQPLTILGWVYRLQDGLLRDLQFKADSAESVAETHAHAMAHAVEISEE
ncbi:MAG TPA: carbonate dehydratase [Gemmatimonadales bacterium]|nr:carbonate dehydratase [Gemmatimonadales bacterium]